MSQLVHVELSQGTVQGMRQEHVTRFSAIPYAQAPVGALRWKPPQPATWQGTLDATQAGPVAPQCPSRLRDVMGDFSARQDEDCLQLTVWTPGVDERKLPVLIWLHGGAWQSGGGALDWYDGSQLASLGDMVVVGVNYRLAALGWLYQAGETANVGLLDQEAAIEWVYQHIERFGGDPERITLMGQSAGASCIAALLMRRPRFHRAILQSGALDTSFRTPEAATVVSQALLRAVGVNTLEEARQRPWQDFLKAQSAPEVTQAMQAEKGRRSLFCLVADGEVLPLHAEQSLISAATQADVLLGYTLDEMRAFPGMSDAVLARQYSDKVFGAPTRRWAERAQAGGRQAWLYEFHHAPQEALGACHCIELPFVFGTLPAFSQAAMLKGMSSEDAQRLTREMQSAWIRFVKGEPLPWPTAPHRHCFM